MKRYWSMSLVLVTVLVLGLGPALAEESQKTIFYNLTTDESWAAGMALAQADMALDAGYKVVVFLNVRGVYLADKGRTHDRFSGTDKTPAEAIAGLIAKGATVQICPMCMKKVGIGKEDLIAGVVLGGSKETFPLMTGDGTTVVSY